MSTDYSRFEEETDQQTQEESAATGTPVEEPQQQEQPQEPQQPEAEAEPEEQDEMQPLKELGSAFGTGLASAARSIQTAPERFIDMATTGEVSKPDFDLIGDKLAKRRNKTWWGGFLENAVHYTTLAVAVGGLGVLTRGKGLKYAPQITKFLQKSNLAKAAVIGAGADLISDRATEDNASAMLVEHVPWTEGFVGWLATKDEDHPLLKTFKSTVEGTGIGTAFDLSLFKIFGNSNPQRAVELVEARNKTAEKITIEKGVAELNEPGYRAAKNGGDAHQAAYVTPEDPKKVPQQLDAIDAEQGAEMGSTNEVLTPLAKETISVSGDAAESEIRRIAKEVLDSDRYKQFQKDVQRNNGVVQAETKVMLERVQRILGRDATKLPPEEYFKELLDISKGDPRIPAHNIYAADILVGSLVKQARNVAVAAREVGQWADIKDVDGPLKQLRDNYIAGITYAKRTRYAWGMDGQRLDGRHIHAEDKAKMLAAVEDAREGAANAFDHLVEQARKGKNDDLLDALVEAFSMSNNIENFKDIDGFLKAKLRGGEIMGKTEQAMAIKELQGVMVHSILSGPKTPMRAAIGTSTLTFLNPLSRALGATIMGAKAEKQAALAGLNAMMQTIPEALKLFKHRLDGYWSGDIATMNTRFMEVTKQDMQWKMLGDYAMTRGTDGDKAAYIIGNVARGMNNSNLLTYSTKLMAATDDAFRLIMARARAREKSMLKVMQEADTLELDAKAFRKYEDDFYSKMLDPEGNIDLESDLFLQSQVKEATLTTDLSSFGADLDRVFAKYPMIKPFFLFARTGINGLAMTAKHTPLLNRTLARTRRILRATPDDLSEVLKDGITTAEELASAKALIEGRQAIGAGVMLAGTFAYMSGNITGNGPMNIAQREQWEAAGWKPRSIKVGNTWVSYDSFEPFGQVISSIADVGDNMQLLGPQYAEDHLARVMFTVSMNMTSKSYMSGLNQLVELFNGDFQKNAGSIAGNLLNNTVPLAALRNDIGKALNPQMRELDKSLMDAIRNRNLASESLTYEDLPMKYDFLNGNPLRDWNFFERIFNAVSPIQFNLDGGPGRRLLIESQYDFRTSFTTTPTGYGEPSVSLREHPRLRSEFMKAMGKYRDSQGRSLEQVLDELAANPTVKDSMAAMRKQQALGIVGDREAKALEPMQAFTHNILIKNAIEKWRKAAWAQVSKTPEAQAVIEEQRRANINNIRSQYATRSERDRIVLPQLNSK